jgi:hypothetical protein
MRRWCCGVKCGRALIALAVQAALPEAAVVAAPTSPCTISAADEAWADDAVAAWQSSARTLTRPQHAGKLRIILFSADCTLISDDALKRGDVAHWTRTAHGDTVPLPDGNSQPVGVASFAASGNDGNFFVMALPSLWQAGGVSGGPLGIARLTTAVLLHEATHLTQSATYMADFTALAARLKLPDSFNDDSIQKRFRGNPDFAGSVAREMDLLYAAVAAPDDASARRLASEAHDLIAARRAKWFTGADAGLADVEDVFLTLEGSGQWAGYAWLVSPQGANLPVAAAIQGFARRSGWWTQDEGLALLLVVDRLAGPGWRDHAFRDGKGTVATFLEAALAAPVGRPASNR